MGPRAGWEPHRSKEDSLAVLRRFIDGKKTFALVDKTRNKVIGSLGVEFYGLEEKLSELFLYQGRALGDVLSKDYWGQGLMREAVKAAIDYLFNALHYDFFDQLPLRFESPFENGAGETRVQALSQIGVRYPNRSEKSG